MIDITWEWSETMAEINGQIQANGVEDEVESQEESKYEIPTATQKEIVITDYIRESLDKVAVAEGFLNYDFIVDHGSSIGDGFVGIMIKVIIKEIDSSKSLQVLAKIPPVSIQIREMMKSMKLFEREVFIYNVLLPEFVAFQQEKKISRAQGFFDFPKVYYADYDEDRDESIIVMEDLRNSGFRMWDKTKPVNFEHAKFIMTALGRYHAISLAMKAKNPEQFEKFKALNDFMSLNFEEESFRGFMESSLVRAMEMLPAEDTKSRARFKKMADQAKQVLNDCVNPDLIEPYGVVGHGDCWVNNFMYHYKKGDMPDEIVLIDWQISRYCSPVVDLTYFIFACTDRQLRQKHFDELLRIYHGSLKELLDHLGGDTVSQFPFTALLRHMKKYAKFGIVMSTFIIPMLQTKKEDIPDMEFIAENMNTDDPAIMAAYMEKMAKSADVVGVRMRDLIHDAILYGYL